MPVPLVSVLLPVYNGANFIGTAIESILAESMTNFELVICDDHSSDATEAVVKEYRDSRIRFTRNASRRGQFGNFNQCIQSSRGEYLHFFSHDDVMEKGALSCQLDALRRFPDCGFVYCGVTGIDVDGAMVWDSSDDETPEYIDRRLYLRIASLYGALPAAVSTVMVRRAAVDRVGPFDPQFEVSGDFELWNRIADVYPVVHTSAQLVRIRSHPGQITTLGDTALKYMREEVLIGKWLQERIDEDEWPRVVAFRRRSRGVTHMNWVLKNVVKGRFGPAREACVLLGAQYGLWRLFGWYLLSAGGKYLAPVPW